MGTTSLGNSALASGVFPVLICSPNTSSKKFSSEYSVVIPIFWRKRWRSINTLRGAIANSSEIRLLSCFNRMSIESNSSRRVMDGTFSRSRGRNSGYSSSKHWRNFDSPSVSNIDGVNVSSSWRLSLSFKNSLISCALISFSAFDWLSFCINELTFSSACFIWRACFFF